MANPRCRCASGRKEKRCCGPLHAGKPAPTPEALMRSRYAAYALGLVDYILQTTDPHGPMWEPDEAGWRASVLAFHARCQFPGVTILEAPTPVGDHGTVTFHARLRSGGRDVGFTERSRFVRRDGCWLYVDGERQ